MLRKGPCTHDTFRSNQDNGKGSRLVIVFPLLCTFLNIQFWQKSKTAAFLTPIFDDIRSPIFTLSCREHKRHLSVKVTTFHDFETQQHKPSEVLFIPHLSRSRGSSRDTVPQEYLNFTDLIFMYSKKMPPNKYLIKRFYWEKETIQFGDRVKNFKDASRLHFFEFVFVKDGPEIKIDILRKR